MSTKFWEKFFDEVVFKHQYGKNPKLFVYKGVLYENKKGKWKPELPEELIKLFKTATRTKASHSKD